MNRHKAREIALQMIFQMDVGKNSWEAAQYTLESASLETSLSSFASELAKGVSEHEAELDNNISAFIEDWDIGRIARIDKSILRLALFEIKYLENIPVVVTINEAVELAKEYGGPDSWRFVNGVLDNYRKKNKIKADKSETVKTPE